MTLPLGQIVFDAGTQVRAAIDEQLVTDYAACMAAGDVFPPVVVFYDGARYYLADGFHRCLACQRNGILDIDVEVRPGTVQDALWFALGANRHLTNGQRLTDADRRHAVVVAVRTFLHDKSQHQIAEQIGCSQGFVSLVISRNHLARPDRVAGTDGVLYPSSIGVREDVRARAAGLLASGKSVAEVRTATGIGRESAYQIQRAVIVQLGLPSARKAAAVFPPKPPHPKAAEIEAMLRQGSTVEQVSKALHVAPQSITKVKIAAGLPYVDKSPSAAAARRDHIRRMAGQGHNVQQIAAALGISEDGCRKIIHDEQIDVPASRTAGGVRRPDANRIVSQTVMDAEHLTADVDLIEFAALDRAALGDWIRSLIVSRAALSSFIRRLQKEHFEHGLSQAAHASPVEDPPGADRVDADSSGPGHPATVPPGPCESDRG